MGWELGKLAGGETAGAGEGKTAIFGKKKGKRKGLGGTKKKNELRFVDLEKNRLFGKV